ncbi:MAG: hypothetical protein WAR37_02155 [Candidatus Microsaccharimonas sp.]
MIPVTSTRMTLRRGFFVLLAAVTVMATVIIPAKTAQAATMQTRTGSYVGNGANLTVSNIGFQPDLVIIKPSTSVTAGYFKTSAMPSNTTAHLSATAVSTASIIVLSSTGFTVSSTASSTNVIYHWIAVGGSDCTSTGTFCVGTYTGNGASTQTISTGFQPEVVVNKRSTAIGPTFRTASMPTNTSEYFTSTASITNGSQFTTFNLTSFTVGTTYSASGGVFYFFAFAESAQMADGTYTGDGVDNRNITGLTFKPSTVFVKNVTSATTNNRRTVFSTSYHYGDNSSFTGDAVVNTANLIQGMNNDGFQVGTGSINESSATAYWFAFGVEPPVTPGSGSFDYREGTYTGTGASLNVTGLPFRPDLVILKDDAANYTVFRTSVMAGDLTAYFATASAGFTGGITAIQSDGFTIGTSTVTNTTGNTYRWQAFGGAYNQSTQTGSSDFVVGAFLGNGIDNRNITGLPFQPDLLAIKSSTATAGIFRTSSFSGDTTSYFATTTDSSNMIQSFTSDGFQVGTGTQANTSGGTQWWFAFKTGANFKVGTYTGNGSTARSVAIDSFGPQYVWAKRSASTTAAAARPSSILDQTSQSFLNVANTTDNITALNGGGFTVGGTQNVSGAVYRYAAWRQPLTQAITTTIVDQNGTVVSSPTVPFQAYTTSFSCNVSTAILGTSLQKIRISNQTSSSTWTTSIAATQGQTALWQNSDTSKKYDYNDTAGGGCSDGGDTDTVGGSLEVQPSGATVTPQSGCSTNQITTGANQAFSEGTISSVTLVSAATGANTGCYWDITDIGLRQVIPLEQLPDTYQLQLSVTTVAS